MSRYRKIISQFKKKRILVIGDVILDQHVYGSVSRISPEAPVPVVTQEGEPLFSPGGAANVANNLRSLGAKVALTGRIGPDPEGRFFLAGLKKHHIPTRWVFVDKRIPTIVKTRIMAQHQQVLRLDREKTDCPDDGRILARIRKFLQKNIQRFDGIIISDYGKGLVTQDLIKEVCAVAIAHKKIITVDPKVEHFAYYRGVTSITPNKKEAENAIRNIKITQTKKLHLTSDRLTTLADVERAGGALLRYMDLQSLLITVGEQGMALFEKGKDPVHIPTKAQEVFDVTGAGDTVISVFTLALTTGATKFQAADLANYAAGVVVGKVGAVPVTRDELITATKE